MTEGKRNNLIRKSLKILFKFALETHFNDYHYDRLGSVCFISDSGGSVVCDYVYDAFGNILSSSGTLSQPYQYIGQHGYYKEPDFNLYLLGQRWYDSETGRFISKDLIPTINLYIYSKNDPLNLYDPSGKQAVIACPVPVADPVCFVVGGILIFCYCRPNHRPPGCYLLLSEKREDIYKEISIRLNGHCVTWRIYLYECTYDCYNIWGEYEKELITNMWMGCLPYLPYF